MSVIETSIDGAYDSTRMCAPGQTRRAEQSVGIVVPLAGRRSLRGAESSPMLAGKYRMMCTGRPRVLRTFGTTPPSASQWVADRWASVGPKCLNDVGGSWSMCIEDPSAKRLWLATDRFGAGAMFYVAQPNRLLFSNSLRSLLAEMTPEVSDVGMVQYLSLRHVAGAEQIIAGVTKVLPGQCIRVDADGSKLVVHAETYFRPRLQKSDEIAIKESEAVRRIEVAMYEELTEGWLCHEDSAGKGMGMLFSSGLDSAYLLCSLTDEQRCDMQLVTFGFQGDPSLDVNAAREAVSCFRTPLNWEPVLLAEQDALAAMDRVILQTELPVDHPNFLSRTWAYENLAERGAKTVIAGEGADTLLGGVWYVSMQKVLFARNWVARMHIPNWALDSLARLHPRLRGRLNQIKERDWQKVCMLAKAYLPTAWLDRALAPWGGFSIANFPFQKSILDRHGDGNPMQGVYEQGLMANMSVELMAEQRMADAVNSQQWNPFLDGRFPDHVCPIPAELRTTGWKQKYLLYMASEGKVPGNILHRPKCGCPAPLVRWFSTERALGGALDLITASNSFCRGLLEADLLEGTLASFRKSPNGADAEVLWVLLNLERWAKLVLLDR